MVSHVPTSRDDGLHHFRWCVRVVGYRKDSTAVVSEHAWCLATTWVVDGRWLSQMDRRWMYSTYSVLRLPHFLQTWPSLGPIMYHLTKVLTWILLATEEFYIIVCMFVHESLFLMRTILDLQFLTWSCKHFHRGAIITCSSRIPDPSDMRKNGDWTILRSMLLPNICTSGPRVRMEKIRTLCGTGTILIVSELPFRAQKAFVSLKPLIVLRHLIILLLWCVFSNGLRYIGRYNVVHSKGIRR